MKISSHQIQQMLKTYGVNKNPGVKAAQGPAKAAKVDQTILSPEAQLLQKVTKAVKEAPEVRTEQVEALRNSIAKGTYSVSGQEIAEKILGRSLVDKLL